MQCSRIATRPLLAATLAWLALACTKQHPGDRTTLTQPASPELPATPTQSAEPAWVVRAKQHPMEYSANIKDSRLFPGGFEENRGQFGGEANFIAQGGDRLLAFNASEVAVFFGTRAVVTKKRGAPSAPGAPSSQTTAWSRLSMRLVGADPSARGHGVHRLPGHTSYFLGKDSTKWLTDVASFSEVQYRQVYPGTDVGYKRDEGDIEYVFRVAPGGDPATIKLAFSGGETPRIEAGGDLVVKVGAAEFRHRRPRLYQQIDGVTIEVDGDFTVNEQGNVGFRIGTYDKKQTLVIDPTIKLLGSTFKAGSFNGGAGKAIVTDQAGNAFITGSLSQITLQGTNGIIATSHALFVSKLDSGGNILNTAIFSGVPQCPLQSLPPAGQNCDGDDEGNAIALDAAGNVYVTGFSSSITFPVVNAFDPCWAGNNPGGCQAPPVGAPDAVVLKLGPDLTTILYASFLGGSSSATSDFGTGIAVDGAGTAVFVVGETHSTDFPVTIGDPRAGASDAFLARFDMSKSGAASLVFSKVFGGPHGDGATCLAWTTALFVGGWSDDFPKAVDPSGANPGAGGNKEGFLARFDSAGTLAMAYFIRGNLDDSVNAVAVDPAENVYLTGSTDSSNFASASPLPATPATGTNVFVAKLHYLWKPIPKHPPHFEGASLDYTTLVAGPKIDIGNAVAVDRAGRAYVTGSTSAPAAGTSGQFPIVGTVMPPLVTSNAGTCTAASSCTTDAFVLRLSSAGSLDYAGLLGGDSDDVGFGITLAAPERVLVVGKALGTFPGRAAATPVAFSDVFVSRIVSGADLAVTKTCTPSSVHAGQNVTCSVVVTNNGPETATNVTAVDRPLQHSYSAQASTTCHATMSPSLTVDRFDCQFGTLAPGATASTTTVMAPMQVGAFTNTVTVGGDDWTPENNVATSTVNVVSDADVVAYTSPVPAVIHLGDSVAFTGWAGNQGPDAADPVGFTYDIPDSFVLNSPPVSTVGPCQSTTNSGRLTVTCGMGRLITTVPGPQAAAVTVGTTPAQEGNFSVTASVTTTATDPNPSNNTMTESLIVRAGTPKLEGRLTDFHKVRGPNGLNIDFEAEFTNRGDGNAKNVVISQINFNTTNGSGTVTLFPPAPPLRAIYSITVGLAQSRDFTVNVPASVRRYEVTLAGTCQDALGATRTFGASGTFVP